MNNAKTKIKPNKKRNVRRRIKKKNNQALALNGIRTVFNEMGVSKDIVGLNNATQLRRAPKKDLLKYMDYYQTHMKQRYLVGLIHPDLAVMHNLQPKLYHDLPIPTGAFGLYGAITQATNSSGNMLVTFRTPGQPGAQYPMQNITINNDASLTGTAINTNNRYVTVQPILAIATQRYRLVSNLVRVTYQGPVLSLTGKFYSSAIYEPCCIKYFNAVNQVDNFVDRYCDFSLIKNGLWNTNVNIADDQHSIEALWVPTDVDDYLFQKPFAYFGTPYTGADILMNPDNEGAHIGYVIAIQGAPAGTPFIIEQWSNYEIIADPTTAPYLTTASDVCFNSADRDNITKAVSNEMSTSGLIRRGVEAPSGSWYDTFNGILDKGIPLISKILSFF